MALLTHSLKIKRMVRVPDDQGGTTESLQVMQIVLGRVSPAGGSEIKTAELYQAEITHAIYLEPKAEIKLHDVVEWRGKELIITVPDLTPSVIRFRKALAKEYQSAG